MTGVVGSGWTTPVTIIMNGPSIGLYACDNYGDEPQWLDADEAREVAAALNAAADKLDAKGGA